MKTKIRQLGNSSAVTLKKDILESLGLKNDDFLDVQVEKGIIKLIPIKRPVDVWEEWCENNMDLAPRKPEFYGDDFELENEDEWEWK